MKKQPTEHWTQSLAQDLGCLHAMMDHAQRSPSRETAAEIMMHISDTARHSATWLNEKEPHR